MIRQVFLSGVIEGFYGRTWSQQTRLAYADYLLEAGLNTYIYCPKGDASLRSRWQDTWADAQWSEFLELGAAYLDRGLNWGVGLSPMALYQQYGKRQQEQLRRKVEYLAELSAPLLAILFDDMPGGLDSLASRQAEIIADVCRWAPGLRILVCPTYYSFDAVLERYFGQRPAHYWAQLGSEMPESVDIFWTGNAVCSPAIAVDDITAINTQLGRPVTLWDNYPVNDGAVRSNFLYTSKLAARSPSLRPHLRGHLCNPMNQGLLSLPALSGLSDLYGSGSLDDACLSRLLGRATWERLAQDKRAFELEGLSGLGSSRCQKLAATYRRLPGAAAQEIAEWLAGEYSFDPECLTG